MKQRSPRWRSAAYLRLVAAADVDARVEAPTSGGGTKEHHHAAAARRFIWELRRPRRSGRWRTLAPFFCRGRDFVPPTARQRACWVFRGRIPE